MAKKAVIVSAYMNTNAPKYPVSVRFVSENDLPNNLTGVNKMIVASTVGASQAKPLQRLFPVSVDVFNSWNLGVTAEELPTDGKDPFIFENPIPAEDVYGYEVGIQVIEKTVPEYKTQEPKKNLQGKVMTYQGMAIYRHYIVQPLVDCGEHVLLENDRAV